MGRVRCQSCLTNIVVSVERMRKLDVNEILAQVDAYFEENKGEEAEKLMQQSIGQAVREQDDASLLHLLNELLGYYRDRKSVV